MNNYKLKICATETATSDQIVTSVEAYVSYASENQAYWNMKKVSSPSDHNFTLNQVRRNASGTNGPDLRALILVCEHYSVCAHFIWKLEAMWHLALNKKFLKFYFLLKNTEEKQQNSATVRNSQTYSLNHFCWSLLIISGKLITDTSEFKSYSCIIVTKNFTLGYCSGNMLDACISEILFQPEYFLFRMKPTAAPRASRQSPAT